MDNNDYTSYEPLAFTVTVDNLEFDKETGPEFAYIQYHEYKRGIIFNT